MTMHNSADQFRRALRFGKGFTGMQNHERMDHPLTNDELVTLAPSIFAKTAHESRSARFTPVPTIDVVDGLRAAGFQPFAAKQAKCREEGRADFTKHLVRFRRPDQNNGHWVNDDAIAEVVLVNANDGTSSYQLYAGIFRTLCLNGLFVADSAIQSVRVGHTGKIIDKVVEGSYAVLEQTTKALEVRDQWAGIELAPREQMAFARAAHALRFEEREEGAQPNAIQPEHMLKVRRDADQPGNLWTVFNRVQENALKGGLTAFTKAGHYANEQGETVYKPSRRVETRAVKGIDQDVKLNKALWTLAQEMAALKVAA
jgi:hypothetical protein